jgi:hypothetical protein
MSKKCRVAAPFSSAMCWHWTHDSAAVGAEGGVWVLWILLVDDRERAPVGRNRTVMIAESFVGPATLARDAAMPMCSASSASSLIARPLASTASAGSS